MATIKAVSSRASIGNAIRYITKNEKTDNKICHSFNCSEDDPIASMKTTKELWGKTNGRQYYHFVQSFAAGENITPELANKMACDLAEHVWGEKYEYVVATHIDREHIHSHIIVNSVALDDGKKFNNDRSVLKGMKEYSDELCIQNGLTITQKGKHFDGSNIVRSEITSGNTETYRQVIDGDGWLNEIYQTVMLSARRSTNREEFIEKCEMHGITVTWEDNRKYITFEDAEGHKVRNKKLGETFHMDLSKEGFAVLFNEKVQQDNELKELAENARSVMEEKGEKLGLPKVPKYAVSNFYTRKTEMEPVNINPEKLQSSIAEPIPPVQVFLQAGEQRKRRSGLMETIYEKFEDLVLKIKEITADIKEYIDGRIETLGKRFRRTKRTVDCCRTSVSKSRQGIKGFTRTLDETQSEISTISNSISKYSARINNTVSRIGEQIRAVDETAQDVSELLQGYRFRIEGVRAEYRHPRELLSGATGRTEGQIREYDKTVSDTIAKADELISRREQVRKKMDSSRSVRDRLKYASMYIEDTTDDSSRKNISRDDGPSL